MGDNFKIVADDRETEARYGRLHTDHGLIETPAFMPVGTFGTVRILSVGDLFKCKVQIITSNAYHLYLKPGDEVIKSAEGLHKFISWERAIFTDSGGFQIYSLAPLRKVTADGISFQSHLDGSHHFLSPEDVMKVGFNLGGDILVPLDECVSYPQDHNDVARSVRLSSDWAERSKRYFDRERSVREGKDSQLLFGIVQGGVYHDLRAEAADRLLAVDFDGYAIGGLSVGEPIEVMYEIAGFTAGLLPDNKPRYLMGIGSPLDILKAVSCGIDLFDCVIPTRNGRNGMAFTFGGVLLGSIYF